jgi:hypothetical protein
MHRSAVNHAGAVTKRSEVVPLPETAGMVDSPILRTNHHEDAETIFG